MGVFLGITMGLVIIPLLIIAGLLLNGRAAFLISGYNMLSDADKAKYNEKALCRFVGGLILVVCFGIALYPAAEFLGIPSLSIIATAIVLITPIGAIVYLNTSKRFLKEGCSHPKGSKKVITATFIITGFIIVAMGTLFFFGLQDPTVNISDSGIRISGMYGLSVDLDDVTDISLIEKNMRDIGVGMRTNGFGGIGQTLKGHFTSTETGMTLLFVQSNSSPTIRIARERGRDIYISFRDSAKTEMLYYELIKMQSRTFSEKIWTIDEAL